VIEVWEVLRAWLAGVGLRTVGERACVDHKTARRYMVAAQQAGLVREGGEGTVVLEYRIVGLTCRFMGARRLGSCCVIPVYHPPRVLGGVCVPPLSNPAHPRPRSGCRRPTKTSGK
jgi:hypothetical protein